MGAPGDRCRLGGRAGSLILADTPIDVIHLQRQPLPGFHSIERMFKDVRDHLEGSELKVQVRINQFASRGLLPRIRDAWAARRAQAAVNHVTGDVHYLAWWLDPQRTILTVHDCVGLSRLQGWRRSLFKYLWYTLPLRRSRHITVVSEFTRSELLAETHCDPARVSVIHPHLSEEFQRVDRAFATGRVRVLQMGTAPNKNIERLAQALVGLEVELIVVGHLNASQRSALVEAGVPLEEKTGLSRAQILEEYVNADVLAFVSTYEGFGLPIIEAQAVGRVVVTSTMCSMPDVAGTAACLVDPFDSASIRRGLCKVISDEKYRHALIDKGFKNVERFRLAAIAEQYAKLYRSVATNSLAATN